MKTLQQQLEEAEEIVASVRKQLEAKEDTSKPNLGDEYWFINSSGDVIRGVWRGYTPDNERLSIGNVYRTRQEAEKEVARRKVMKKLKDLAGGFVPNWDDLKEYRHSIYFNRREGAFGVNDHHVYDYIGLVYFQTEEAAQHAIDVLGDELDVLL